MTKQKIFNYKFNKLSNSENFYVNSTNSDAFNGIINNNNLFLFLTGPKKSGKTVLGEMWLKKNSGIEYNNNFENILQKNKNILIDNFDLLKNEENLFHIMNHCFLNNLKILITSEKFVNDFNFKLNDISSRLKIFENYQINNPDDDMLLKILTKLFIDRQFIINTTDIFEYILKRSNRSYDDMYNIVKKLDTLSLEKKKTINNTIN